MRYLISILVLTFLAVGVAQDGEAAYNTSCVACHQATGDGLPGAFPNLNGSVSVIAGLEGGRDYLIKTILFGMMGEITVGETTYNGAMPAWSSISDEDIAAILNYIVTSWEQEVPEGFEDYTAEEVEAVRAEELSMDDVLALRNALVFGE